MEKRIRVKTTPLGGDKFLNVKLQQNFDTIDILSLSIKKEDLYRYYESNYGLVVGRVNLNSGLGVENAKVSIFIPLSDEDDEREDIKGVYPYKDVFDVNGLGYRYNLFTPTSTYKLGSFPSKIEVIRSETMGEIYKKYYKFTTVTNASGDYMFFGVPTGAQTLHVDIDITDIGSQSFTINELKTSGIPTNNFSVKEDGGLTLKVDSNLSSLPNILSQNITIDVKPLWGNINEDNIGITRCDLNFNLNVSTYTTFITTMGFDFIETLKDSGWLWSKDYEEMHWYNDSSNGAGDIANRIAPGRIENLLPFIGDKSTNRLGDVYVKVYQYDDNGVMYETANFSREDEDELKNNGFLVLKLPCYSHKIITNEYGDIIYSTDNTGLPTAGAYSIEISTDAGYVQTGGQFYGYLLNKSTDSLKPFIMERNRLYSTSFKVKRNKKIDFAPRKGNLTYAKNAQIKQDNLTKQMYYENVSDTSKLSYEQYLKNTAMKDFPFEFETNDWINGMLYFGRMANGGDKKNQSPPTQLQYQYRGRLYYNVETRIIDITNVSKKLASTPEYISFYSNNNDFQVGNIQQDLSNSYEESNGSPKGLVKDRGQGKYIFINGIQIGNINNLQAFRKYYEK